MDAPVSFSAAVQPIYMPNEGTSFNNAECWITGWGETRSRLLVKFQQTEMGLIAD